MVCVQDRIIYYNSKSLIYLINLSLLFYINPQVYAQCLLSINLPNITRTRCNLIIITCINNAFLKGNSANLHSVEVVEFLFPVINQRAFEFNSITISFCFFLVIIGGKENKIIL